MPLGARSGAENLRPNRISYPRPEDQFSGGWDFAECDHLSPYLFWCCLDVNCGANDKCRRCLLNSMFQPLHTWDKIKAGQKETPDLVPTSASVVRGSRTSRQVRPAAPLAESPSSGK